MSHWIQLETPCGTVNAWRADPGGLSRGAVLVVQEIFGVTGHIRNVADRLAEAGFLALAPALFDPVSAGAELGYDTDGMQRGRELVGQLGTSRAMDILGAANHCLQREGHRVGAMGFCWGGSLAFLCNTRLGLPSVSYYGARSVPHLDEEARGPMLFHFGGDDDSIPEPDIDLHRRKQPQATIHVYPGAGHAFNRDDEPKLHDAESARLAWQRSIDFMTESLR